ncbi:unnamed protein product [marine sediment metagenome]|uniref:Methyltransferase domain-containing protein n=1 Tax=marine sediment metagenome TaxID=412755 RepID=X0RSE6_9ZZZZ
MKRKRQSLPKTAIPDITQYYARLFRKFGDDPKSDGYSHELARKARFEMYMRHFDFNQKSILDVGCGTGMFIEHLVLRGIRPKRWIGTDILPGKVAAAKRRLKKNGFIDWCKELEIELKFVTGTVDDVLDLVHIAIACSIFDVKQRDVSTTFKLACKTLASMWGRVTEGVGADFFSPYALDIQPFNAPIPPEWLLTWAMHNLSQRVLVDYTYLPHDYSVIAMKEDNEFVREWKKAGGWKRETGGEHD